MIWKNGFRILKMSLIQKNELKQEINLAKNKEELKKILVPQNGIFLGVVSHLSWLVSRHHFFIIDKKKEYVTLYQSFQNEYDVEVALKKKKKIPKHRFIELLSSLISFDQQRVATAIKSLFCYNNVDCEDIQSYFMNMVSNDLSDKLYYYKDNKLINKDFFVNLSFLPLTVKIVNLNTICVINPNHSPITIEEDSLLTASHN